MSFCKEVNFGLEIRSRISFELRQAQREFVNSIMNLVFMTLPRKVLPSADLTLQTLESIMTQGFGKHVSTLVFSSDFLNECCLAKHMLAEGMQLNWQMLGSWAKLMSIALASSSTPTLPLNAGQVTLGADACGNLIPKSWISWIRSTKQIASLIKVDRATCSASVVDNEAVDHCVCMSMDLLLACSG